jgi:RND family efflux transporter MFP subunit
MESGNRPDLSALRMEHDELEYRPRRRWLGWLIALLLLAGVAAWVFLAPAPFLLPKVQTTSVQVVTPTEASTVLTATGYTYARERAAVGSRVIGRVVELKVDEGDKVRKGDVIAVLDSADLRASIQEVEAQIVEARARLANAQREEQRQGSLNKEGVIAASAYDAAKTTLDVARAQVGTVDARLRSLKAQLDYTVIRSPLSGVVVDRNVEVGEMVAPGGFTSQQSTGAIVRIADPRSLEVEADINEAYIARIKPGQPASIRVDAVPDRQYRGKLRQVVPTADRQKAVVQVKVTIEDTDERLVPDMSSTVTFLETESSPQQRAEAKPKVYVPKSAVLGSGSSVAVFQVENGALRRTEIQVVPPPAGDKGDRLEVLSGLSGGETIVRSNVTSLKDGQKVRVVEGSTNP